MNILKIARKSFTLVELLIVIGILGILVVTVLTTLNPGEAQKKSRDAKRMKDIATLQTVIEQYLNDSDGTTNPAVCTAVAGCTSSANTACNNGWITGADLCPYISSLPTDPLNGADRAAVNTVACATATLQMHYKVRMQTDGSYEIQARQESVDNCKNVSQDGGEDFNYVELFNNLNNWL